VQQSLKIFVCRLAFIIVFSSHLGTYGIKSTDKDSRGLGDLNFFRRVVGRGGSLVNFLRGARYSNPAEPVWARVRASSRNAPTPSGMDEGNVLSVIVLSRDLPVSMIKVSLPEREQCYEGDNGVCTGYMFNQGPSGGCDIVQVPDSMKLPKKHAGKIVVDALKMGLIEACEFNNTVGDRSSKLEKRSELKLSLKQGNLDMLKNTLLVFQVRVRNPPTTPVSRANSRFTANTYRVNVRSKAGEVGEKVLPAPKILSVWRCAYTSISWTSACTAKCGGGVSYGVRRLLHPPPMEYPAELLVNCDFPLSFTRPCNEMPCSVHCRLGEWTPFADGPCSVTCGEGFMVERRRVIEGPVGLGQPCPAWDSKVRVRFSPCRGRQKDCAPRCDPTDEKISSDATLYGACSNICHGGIEPQGQRSIFRVAERKATSATEESCGFAKKLEPCGIPCKYINFFPGDGKLPRLGKWADIVLVLSLVVRVDDLFLLAPPGFEIGKQEGSNQCLLKSHNLPRLKACIVDTADDGRMRATFQLLNPLEHRYKAVSGDIYKPKFEIHFWAKSPSACDGGFDDTTGACKDSPKWIWHLFYNDQALENFGQLDAGSEISTVQKGDNMGVYNVYGPEARESSWEPLQPPHVAQTEAQEERDWAADLAAIAKLNTQQAF